MISQPPYSPFMVQCDFRIPEVFLEWIRRQSEALNLLSYFFSQKLWRIFQIYQRNITFWWTLKTFTHVPVDDTFNHIWSWLQYFFVLSYPPVALTIHISKRKISFSNRLMVLQWDPTTLVDIFLQDFEHQILNPPNKIHKFYRCYVNGIFSLIIWNEIYIYI